MPPPSGRGIINAWKYRLIARRVCNRTTIAPPLSAVWPVMHSCTSTAAMSGVRLWSSMCYVHARSRHVQFRSARHYVRLKGADLGTRSTWPDNLMSPPHCTKFSQIYFISWLHVWEREQDGWETECREQNDEMRGYNEHTPNENSKYATAAVDSHQPALIWRLK